MGLEQDCAFIYLRFENRLAVIQAPGHVDILRALAGEHKHNRPLLRFIETRGGAARVKRAQRLKRIIRIAADNGPPMVELTPAHLERVSHVGKIQVLVIFQMRCEISGCRFQCGAGLGREQEQLPRPCLFRRCQRRWFLHDDVRVGATDAEGAYTCA